jgi:maltooligosyltrehalose trehalohydrolase
MSRGRLKIAAAIVLTAPFVPLVFQGEEWGASTPFQYFTDHDDPDLGRAVSEGRRSEFAAFGWNPDEVPDPQSQATYARSKLEWREFEREPHAGLFAWYHELIRLRRMTPALADGRMDLVHVDWDEHARWLTLDRGPVTLVCNLAAQPQTVPTRQARPSHLLLSSEAGVTVGSQGVTLPADAVVVLGPERPGLHSDRRTAAASSAAPEPWSRG